ncbi:MAG: YncE family protein [Nitrososphaerota archaeon]|nr:YncE family protein [Nitrososphaerota archaeon]MDG7048711.1 YncE family protein [Nitrososphaerota archaeon]MDG7051697.1 YncE family protein [Nitrososphaerota archaeon]
MSTRGGRVAALLILIMFVASLSPLLFGAYGSWGAGGPSSGTVFAQPVNSTTVLPYNTSGSVLYTLLLHNGTLLYGNQQTNTNPSNDTNPYAVTYDTADRCIYVTNGSGSGPGSVQVINSSTEMMVANIGVGPKPYGIAYDSANGYMYVTDYGSDAVSVINTSSQSVITTIPVGHEPYGIAYDSANGYLYVADSGSTDNNYYISVIDPTMESVVGIINMSFNAPLELLYDPSNGYIYATIPGGGRVAVIDPVNDSALSYIAGFNGPYAIAYDPSNGLVYVTNAAGSEYVNTVAVINTSVESVQQYVSLPVGAGQSAIPWGIAYDPLMGSMYVSESGMGQIAAIDCSTQDVTAAITVGSTPYGIAYDPANGYMYVANEYSGTLSVIYTENPLTYYAYYQGSLHRSMYPFSLGNTMLEKLNGNGSVTMDIDSSNSSRLILGYGYTYGKLGNLTGLEIVGSGPYYVDLWFDASAANDTSANGPFFSWTSGGIMSSLNGDVNGSTAPPINGNDTIGPSTVVSINAINYTLLQLQAGDYAGINNSTLVGIWVGINSVANENVAASVDPGVEFYATGAGPDTVGNVLTISYFGNTYFYNYTQLPVTVEAPVGTAVSYSWTSPLSTSSTGKIYSWTSTSGLASTRSAVIYLTGSGDVVATYVTQYNLTLLVNPSGSGSVTPKTGYYNQGATVQLAISPDSGWVFNSWTGSGSGSYTGSSSSPSVIMNGPIIETANLYAGITLSASGIATGSPAVVVTVNGTAFSCSQLPLTLYAAPNSILTYSFAQQVLYGTGNRSFLESVSGLASSQSGTLTVTSPGAIIGTYQRQYYLSMVVNPAGAGAVNTTSGYSVKSGWYTPNIGGQLMAIPAPGWSFAKWVGSGSGSYTGTLQMPTIYLNGPVNETVYFDAGITVSVSGLNAPGTAVIIDGLNYSLYQLPRTFYLSPGSIMDFTFISPIAAGGGTRFVWTSTAGISDERSGSVTISSPGSLTGKYGIQYSVTFQSYPANGSFVYTDFGSGLTPFTIWEPSGSVVTYIFNSSFSGGQGIRYIGPDPLNGSLTVTGQSTITANYSTTQYYLTTYVNGSTSDGSVSPSSGWYDAGSSVIVRATGGTGHCFWGWTTGSMDNPTTVIMSGPESLGANFLTEGELWYGALDYGSSYPVHSTASLSGPVTVQDIQSGDSTWLPPGWYYINYGMDSLGERAYSATTSLYVSSGGNITDMAIYNTPTRLSAGFTVGVGTYTISGYLRTADNGMALGGQTVNVTFSTDGGQSWHLAGSVTTNSAGYYSYTVNDPYGSEGITNSNASFSGNDGYLGCSSPTVGN